MTLDEASRLRLLTAPDGDFPLVELDVEGVRLEMFDRDPRTMRDAFLATAAHADRDAVVFGDERWTYADQWATVVAVAHALHDELGVCQGDHIGIAMRNYPEFIFSFWAAQLLGAVVIPFNGWLRARELTDLIAESRPVVLVADRERVALVADADLAASGVKAVVGVRCPPGTQGPAGAEQFVAWEDLLVRRGRVTEPPEVEVAPEDPSTILFTSGTTGKPKGARHTHRNHSASLLNKLIRAMQVVPATETTPLQVLPPGHSVKLVTFPFFHIAGMNTLYTASYSGHTLVLMYKWNADDALALVETERVNELAGPPFVIQTFLEAAEDSPRDLSSLRIIGMGGSAPPPQLIARLADRFGGQVTPRTGYGLTETTSGVVSISAADFALHPASVGRPLPTAEVAILDEDGTRLGTGLEGEIAIRGPQVVSGYYDQPDAEEFRDGWFRTGDLGRIDDEGLIYIVGRLKDVVIRGGENINCSEVEAVLNQHPEVLEAAAFGAPHPKLGEELVAVARVRPGSTLAADELRSYVAERLAAFKVPARIAISGAELPRTPSGKIVKRDIVSSMQLGDLLQPAVGG
jgi:long-chain acyl-CoA synthetase